LIKIQAYLDQVGLKLKNVFITHLDWDHVENRPFFEKEGVTFYDFTNVREDQIIKMGNKTFRIIFTDGHKNPKHHISVIVNDDVLVAGDILVQGVSPLILVNNVIDKNPKEIFKNSLESLRDSQYSVIIPGHGPVYVDNSLIDNELKVFYKTLKINK
jgi:glyoxylase-like metal-dependent hydrolase (beta-lactamase superfamily II)